MLGIVGAGEGRSETKEMARRCKGDGTETDK
jgi:hypothetical protein